MVNFLFFETGDLFRLFQEGNIKEGSSRVRLQKYQASAGYSPSLRKN